MSKVITGIDIGTSAIKAVQIAQDKVPRLLSFGSIKTPEPGLLSDVEVDLERVAQAIKSLLGLIKASPSSVVVSIPESKIFSRVISDLPFLSDDEISASIGYSLEEFVPLPKDQVEIYWQVIGRSKEKNQTSVLVIVVPKKLQSKYLKVLDLAGVKPIALETEMISATRVLINDLGVIPSLIIQLGASTTDICVISNGVILMTRSLSTGGNVLTKSVSQYLNLPALQAEEYKKAYGLLTGQLDNKIFQTLSPIIESITGEVQRLLQSFQSKYPNSKVARAFIIGGGAKLPGLVPYLGHRLGVEVIESDPWSQVSKSPDLAQKLKPDPTYIISLGLALRNN